jgi:hypothetical protein
MASEISIKEKNKLYHQIRVLAGAPVRKVEVADENMDVLLDVAIEEYSGYINNWLIEQQWVNLQNLGVNTADLTFALTTKTLDFEKSFTYAYSKQVGVGTNSPWELKKDYVVVTADTQLYDIPANREINEVLWLTPPQIDNGILDPFAMGNWFAGDYGWSYMGRPAQYVLPSYSVMLSAQDRFTKRKLMQSELTYRITGGANGKKVLHLYPVPGSRQEISGKFGRSFEGTKVWYWYYDTNSQGRDECLEQNNDIIKLPNDVPINTLTWDKLNTISQARVRRLLLAKVKNYMATVRGTFSGTVPTPNDKELKMDYSFLLEQAKNDEEKVYTEIKDSLDKLSLKQLMLDRADISDALKRVLSNQPSKLPIFMM